MSDKIVYVEGPEGIEQYLLQPNHFSIDPSNLDYDLCNLGAIMLEYGQIEARLRAEVDRKDAALDKLEADLDAKIRSDASSIGEKITEAKVKNKIISDVSMQNAIASLNQSKYNHNLMRWAMSALQKKCDCLINLSYRERQMMRAETTSI